jgi:trk system potassium uptake protein
MIIKTKQRESIIIVGCSDIGAGIAKMLAEQDKDVKIIDYCSSSFKKLKSNLTIEQITGDGTDISILRQCGIEHATVFLAATDKDRTNIMIAEIAKEVFKVPKVIAKICDFENNTQFMEHSNVQPFYPYLLAMKELEKLFESKCQNGRL